MLLNGGWALAVFLNGGVALVLFLTSLSSIYELSAS